jgi:hypothetical protein
MTRGVVGGIGSKRCIKNCDQETYSLGALLKSEK